MRKLFLLAVLGLSYAVGATTQATDREWFDANFDQLVLCDAVDQGGRCVAYNASLSCGKSTLAHSNGRLINRKWMSETPCHSFRRIQYLAQQGLRGIVPRIGMCSNDAMATRLC